MRTPQLLAAIQEAIGQDIAVENTFLVVKWPGRAFEIPWHQDGIDARLELDPDRSVSAWLAISDATVSNGCLHAVPGSHHFGYLPFSSEAEHGAERGRADQATGFTADTSTALPLPAGSALLMDSRLLHRSGTNTSNGARVGLNVRSLIQPPPANTTSPRIGPGRSLPSRQPYGPASPTTPSSGLQRARSPSCSAPLSPSPPRPASNPTSTTLDMNVQSGASHHHRSNNRASQLRRYLSSRSRLSSSIRASW
ncbi:phytanoyl-CoA dioxygenase family protein [Kitasatospora sp. NPDC127121]|uniref:phytanoyl-CoA dioxygenase family protein n=1 Tax=Kitasatospora sp. NPDC127121 TaxID=3345371 RepID=UPI00362DC376